MKKQVTYCGFVAIVGRPNVGKSTLLNQLVGQKISITSRKPQTTQHRIMGIHTQGVYQVAYLDTPGIRAKEKQENNLLTNRAISASIFNSELIMFVVEGIHWTPNDNIVFNKLRGVKCPVVLVINKLDMIRNKERLLPYMQFLSQKMHFHGIVPICAKNGTNVNSLAVIVNQALPIADHYFPKEYTTNRPQYFMALEIIREKLMRFLGDEIPYSVMVKIERFVTNNDGKLEIHGLILVGRESQKKIVIGNKGRKIKTIGIAARMGMQTMFKRHVYLQLWVRVRPRPTDDKDAFCNLRYIEDC